MMHYYVANGQMTDRAKPKCSAKNLPQYLSITDSKMTTTARCLKQD